MNNRYEKHRGWNSFSCWYLHLNRSEIEKNDYLLLWCLKLSNMILSPSPLRKNPTSFEYRESIYIYFWRIACKWTVNKTNTTTLSVCYKWDHPILTPKSKKKVKEEKKEKKRKERQNERKEGRKEEWQKPNWITGVWLRLSRKVMYSYVLLWTPAYGQAKAGRPARTYTQQLCEDTGCSPEDLPDGDEW